MKWETLLKKTDLKMGELIAKSILWKLDTDRYTDFNNIIGMEIKSMGSDSLKALCHDYLRFLKVKEKHLEKYKSLEKKKEQLATDYDSFQKNKERLK